MESLDDLDTGFQAESLLCWAKISVRFNAQMTHYRETIISIIQEANHLVKLPCKNKKYKKISPQIHKNQYPSQTQNQLTATIEEVRDSNYKLDCEKIAKANELTDEEYKALKKCLVKTAKERKQLKKYDLQRRYCLPVTPELVALDDDGWYQKLRTHYFLTKGRNYLADRDQCSKKIN